MRIEKRLLGLFLTVFFCQALHAKVQFSVSNLIDWLSEMETSGIQLSHSVRQKAKDYRYILVRGYLNELILGYMKENKKALIEFGVPEDQIHFMSPPSALSIKTNTQKEREELEEYAAMGQPLVLIGHSKGAANIVAFALQNKDFVEKHIKAILPIQGVFGGSGIADAFYFWRHKYRNPLPKDKWPGFRAWLFSGLALAARPFVTAGSCVGLFRGMKSLTHKHNTEFWNELRDQCQDAIPMVAEKLLFLRTQQHPDRQVFLLRAMASYLHHAYGDSDGLVQVDEQFLPWLLPKGGECPVLLDDANHHSLTHTGFATNSPQELRRRLMAAILMGLAL